MALLASAMCVCSGQEASSQLLQVPCHRQLCFLFAGANADAPCPAEGRAVGVRLLPVVAQQDGRRGQCTMHMVASWGPGDQCLLIHYLG